MQGKMLGTIRGSKKGGAPEMAGEQKLGVRKHKIRRNMIPAVALQPKKRLNPFAIAEFFGCDQRSMALTAGFQHRFEKALAIAETIQMILDPLVILPSRARVQLRQHGIRQEK